MASTVRIDISLFLDMMVYVIRHPDRSDEKYHQIRVTAEKKLQAMINHESYSIMKTDPGAQKRHKAFKDYLQEKGIDLPDD